jgi:hypothetical protein
MDNEEKSQNMQSYYTFQDGSSPKKESKMMSHGNITPSMLCNRRAHITVEDQVNFTNKEGSSQQNDGILQMFSLLSLNQDE